MPRNGRKNKYSLRVDRRRAGFFLCLLLLSACKLKKTGSELREQPRNEDGQSPFEIFNPRSWVPAGAEAIQDQSIRGKLEVLSLNLANVGTLTGNGTISINKDQQKYIRQESWTIDGALLPGAVLATMSAETIPISVRLAAGKQAIYTRPFQSQTDALKARPILFTDLPLNHKKALGMKLNDFASIPTKMGIVLGLDAMTTSAPYAARAGFGVFWNGEYRVNIYRLDEKRVRIKIAPSDAKGFEFHAGVGARLDFFGYKNSDYQFLDRYAERTLGLDFIKLAHQRILDADKLSLDYTFNLGDPDAQKAFDSIMSTTLALKAQIHPRVNAENLALFSDLTPTEWLCREDQSLDPSGRRVSRNANVKGRYQSESTLQKFGMNPLNLKSNESTVATDLTITSGYGTFDKSYHRVVLFSNDYRLKSWIQSMREHASVTLSGYLQTDTRFVASELQDLTFRFSFGSSSPTDEDIKILRAIHRAVISDDTYHQLTDASPIQDVQSLRREKYQSDLTVVCHHSVLFEFSRLDAQRQETVVRQVKAILVDKLQYFSTFLTKRPIDRALSRLSSSLLSMANSTSSDVQYQELKEIASIMDDTQGNLQFIVPAYLSTLSQVINLGSPYVALKEQYGKNTPTYFREVGTDLRKEYRNTIDSALYELTHLGYESQVSP
jgi:hypothetical protein